MARGQGFALRTSEPRRSLTEGEGEGEGEGKVAEKTAYANEMIVPVGDLEKRCPSEHPTFQVGRVLSPITSFLGPEIAAFTRCLSASSEIKYRGRFRTSPRDRRFSPIKFRRKVALA